MGSTAPLPPQLAVLHRELGIPPHYAAARGLAFQPEADEATLIEVALNPDGRAVNLVPAAATAWRRMQSAAAADGKNLVAVSGFRSVARQTKIIRDKLSAGQAIGDILRLIAAPGFSEHHTGRALDIGSPGHLELEEDFAASPEFAWLQQRAAEFGFRLSYPRNNATGIGFEPWHWYFDGPRE